MTEAATDHMKAKGIQGSVVKLASIAAQDGVPSIKSHSASKAAPASTTKTNATELRPHRIRVNTINICCCFTDAENADPKMFKSFDRLPKAEALHSQPIDMASIVGHLLSDASTMLTGTIIDFAPEQITGAYE